MTRDPRKTAANGIITGHTRVPRCRAGNTPGLYTRLGGAALTNDSSVSGKTCSRCKESKPLSEFYANKSKPLGVQQTCKVCQISRTNSPEVAGKRERKKSENRALHTEEFYEAAYAADAHKKCASCQEHISVSQFYKRAEANSGFQSWCIQCHKARLSKAGQRAYWRKKTYGISSEEYEALLKKQDYKCAICKKECPTLEELAVDHCHKGGHVRGLLCLRCNTGIGYMQDDPTIISNALDYLLRL